MSGNNRIMIAAPSSGSGKTTVTMALRQIFKERGMETASFKCGPDYIDAMYHESSNLDLYMSQENTVKYLLCRHAEQADIAVIEGVMGYYDGKSFDSLSGSSYEIAKVTDTPVILVLNCKGMAHSIIPYINGFVNYVKDSHIEGVILNNITKSTYERIKPLITGVKVCGYVPGLPENLIFESRHLGLMTPHDRELLQEKTKQLAAVLSDTLDIEAIMEVSGRAEKLSYTQPEIVRYDEGIHVAVAYDEAFCFYYRDNLQLLEDMGAKIRFFSPLRDKTLPENTDFLYIGGGYPEVFEERLRANKEMIQSIRDYCKSGKVYMAECGGFMYLMMCDIIKGSMENKGHLVRFGYITVTGTQDTLLAPAGTAIRCHEFHYYDTDNNGEDLTAVKTNGTTYGCGHCSATSYAGFPHIYFYNDISMARRIYECCLSTRKH